MRVCDSVMEERAETLRGRFSLSLSQVTLCVCVCVLDRFSTASQCFSVTQCLVSAGADGIFLSVCVPLMLTKKSYCVCVCIYVLPQFLSVPASHQVMRCICE